MSEQSVDPDVKAAAFEGSAGSDVVTMRPALLPRRGQPSDDSITVGAIVRGTSMVAGVIVVAYMGLVMLGFPFPLPGLGPLAPVDILAVGALVAVTPMGLHAAREAKRVRLLEERFPDFLRDLAANRRAGIPLSASVELAAEADYGALSPEVERMASQLSWNVPFDEVVRRFSERVQTPLVQRACTLILEAEYSGGRITDVLDAVSRDVRALQALKNERQSSMAMYTVVVYLTFLVFLGVAAMLYWQFLPELLVAQDVPALGDAVSGARVSLEDYRQFFYVASLVQALGGGVLAGVLSYHKYGPGLRHAAVMMGMAFVVFSVLAV